MTEELTYLPTNDIMFKLIFGSIGNEKITQKFIESILGKKIKPITLGHKLELEIPSPTSKQMVADVIAKDKEQKKYVLEMQRTKTKGLLQRFLGYDCKLYVSGIKKKEQYDTIKQATLIVIMEEPFPGLEKIKDYHTVIDLAIKAHTEIEFNNVIQLHIIELEKYQEQKKSAGKIEPWLEFIIDPEGEEMIKMARTQAELEEAVRQLRLLNADDEVREIAEAQEWAEYMRWYELHEEREEARTTGRREGRKEGRKEGRQEGRKEEKKAIAKKMLEQKADIKFIMTCTGLTKKEIEELNFAV